MPTCPFPGGCAFLWQTAGPGLHATVPGLHATLGNSYLQASRSHHIPDSVGDSDFHAEDFDKLLTARTAQGPAVTKTSTLPGKRWCVLHVVMACSTASTRLNSICCASAVCERTHSGSQAIEMTRDSTEHGSTSKHALHTCQWLCLQQSCESYGLCTTCSCASRKPRAEPQSIRADLLKWAYDQTLGRVDGSAAMLPLGDAPPKAGLCTVLFNPFYRIIFVKNTKVAGTSVFLHFGGKCKRDAPTLDQSEVRPCTTAAI